MTAASKKGKQCWDDQIRFEIRAASPDMDMMHGTDALAPGQESGRGRAIGQLQLSRSYKSQGSGYIWTKQTNFN